MKAKDILDFPAMEDALALRLSRRRVGEDHKALLGELSCYARALVDEGNRPPSHPIAGEERTRTIAWLQRPVFVCGHHRSGTTLMQRLLDGHPDLVVLPDEGNYFTSFHYVARSSPTTAQLNGFIDKWICRFVDPNSDLHFKIGRAGPHGNPGIQFVKRVLAWHAALQDLTPSVTPFEALLALVASFKDVVAPYATPRRWVEKTPLNEHFVERLAVFPEARFIHLVRDPTATLESLLVSERDTGVKGSSAADCARRIGRSLRLARTNAERFGKRYLVVRYEDLLADTAGEMNRVRSHLDLSAHASLVIPTDCGQVVRSNSSFEVGAPGVIVQPRQRHPTETTNARLVSAFCASAARHFGYTVAGLTGITRTALLIRYLPPMLIRRLGTWTVHRATQQ
jgi:Sulfotransferase family